MSNRMILPGATLGVLGSGQLGRMFSIAARQMGYRVHIYSPDSDSPAGQIGDVEVVAPYAGEWEYYGFLCQWGYRSGRTV